MASRRLGASAINWTAFAERVPASQKAQFFALKAKTDAYLRKVNAFPAEPPKIDFNAYKSKVAIAGLVDSFQKQYEAVSVPYPTEKVTPQIDEQEKLQVQAYNQFIEESHKRIKEHETVLDKWKAILPYEEMTMEDYFTVHPDRAIDTVNNPTVYPHEPDFQFDSPEGIADAEETERYAREDAESSLFGKLLGKTPQTTK